jgi:hypothetical protein
MKATSVGNNPPSGSNAMLSVASFPSNSRASRPGCTRNTPFLEQLLL